MNLRKLAEGKPCYLRLYPFCNHQPETTVLAHIRRGGTAGGAMKPVDINGAPVCSRCHAVYDGEKQAIYSRTELDAEMLRAHCQWLDYLWKEELIILVAA